MLDTQHVHLPDEESARRFAQCYVGDVVMSASPTLSWGYRERVFRVFERLSSQGSGTGIGLAIFRRVAESCDGRAWMEASPEGGCRVLCELAGEPDG